MLRSDLPLGVDPGEKPAKESGTRASFLEELRWLCAIIGAQRDLGRTSLREARDTAVVLLSLGKAMSKADFMGVVLPKSVEQPSSKPKYHPENLGALRMLLSAPAARGAQISDDARKILAGSLEI